MKREDILINTNMSVIFTGSKTENKDCFNSLLDGEHILYDKYSNYINLYAVFIFIISIHKMSEHIHFISHLVMKNYIKGKK